MIEIPESANLSEQLNKTIQGKTVLKVTKGLSPHKFAFFSKEIDNYQELLGGQTIIRANQAGGQVELEMEDAVLLLGDGVNMRYLMPGAKLPAKHQLLIEFEDASSLVCTVQMYGLMIAFLPGLYDSPYYTIAKEKPNPLTDAFDEAYFNSLLSQATKGMSVKAFLATEQRIPGFGNGVLQDVLFEVGIHPKKKMLDMKDAQLGQLFHAVKSKLREMAQGGGRDTEKDLFGNTGGYQTILSAKTIKGPCPVCGSTILRQAFLGGNVYFCPICQPLE